MHNRNLLDLAVPLLFGAGGREVRGGYVLESAEREGDVGAVGEELDGLVGKVVASCAFNGESATARSRRMELGMWYLRT